MFCTILGNVGVESHPGQLRGSIGNGKVKTLFSLLLVESNRFVTTRQVIEELWPVTPPPRTAPTAVQVHVSKLRKTLQALVGPDADSYIQTRTNGYQFSLAVHECDLLDFRRRLVEARQAEERGDLRSASDLLQSSLQLWRGEPLGDVVCGPLLTRAAHILRETRIAALERRIEIDLKLGRHADLIGELYALASEFPFWENIYVYLITALYRSGRAAEALTTYRQLHQFLIDELGMEPSPEVRRLQTRVLTRDPLLEPSPLHPARSSAGRADQPRPGNH